MPATLFNLVPLSAWRLCTGDPGARAGFAFAYAFFAFASADAGGTTRGAD